MKSGKDVSYTSGKSPSPVKANKERIERNLRDYQRIIKRIDRVLATDSPEWLGYTKSRAKAGNDAIDRVDDAIGSATGVNLDRAKERANQADSNITGYLEKGFTDSSGHIVEADKYARGWLEKGYTDVSGNILKTDKPLAEYFEKGVTDLDGKLLDLDVKVYNPPQNIINNIDNIIEGFDIVFPDFNLEGLSALALLPGIILAIRNDVAGWFKFDIGEYQATVKMLEKLTKPPEME